MNTPKMFLAALAWTLPLAGAMAQPFVTNRTTSVYAVVPDPVTIAFGADGTLYVGRDASGSGGSAGAAVKIHRVAPGGETVAEFGDIAISDPDAVTVDVAGSVSGTPGAVLVGGVHNDGSTGRIVKIAPDGTVTTLFAPTATWLNPSDFAFDPSGRLLLTDVDNGRVLITTGDTPTILFTLAGAHRLAVDALGRIAVSSRKQHTIAALHQRRGADQRQLRPRQGQQPGGARPGRRVGHRPLRHCPQRRPDPHRPGRHDDRRVGGRFVMASGAVLPGLDFGPDGALYVSEFDSDLIWRVAPVEADRPRLTATLIGPQQVRLSWTPSTPGFVLQESSGISSAAWTNFPSGETNPVPVPATLPTKFYRPKFYRLFKP